MVEAMAIPGMGATLKTAHKIKTPARGITLVPAKVFKSGLAFQNTGAKKLLCRCSQKSLGNEIITLKTKQDEKANQKTQSEQKNYFESQFIGNEQ